MVSIAIVAVLSSTGLVVFSNAQSAARDSKRREDVTAIAKALESKKSSTFTGATLPQDPKNTNKYCFQALTTVPPVAPPLKATAWDATGACPTAPGTWTDISAGGAETTFGAATSWTVCTLLEQGTAPNIYCEYSKQ